MQAIYKPARTLDLPDQNIDQNSTTDRIPTPDQTIARGNSDQRSENPLSLSGGPTGPFEPIGPRLGLIIAKRFLPRAVDRNHLKRLIRENFRIQRPELPETDIIVRLMRKPAAQVSAGEVAALFGKMQRAESAVQNRSQKN